MKIELDIPDNIATIINDFLQFQANKPDSISSHGPLDMQTLALMLLQDVYWATERPGSWEGANMRQVLEAHGYFI